MGSRSLHVERAGSGQRVAALFAGVGGIERGLEASGHRTVFLCENNSAAQAVLRDRFPRVDLNGDIEHLTSLPGEATLVTAGFPCQDLSQAGTGAGIDGSRSGLVERIFELLQKPSASSVEWLLLENVPFMLQLDRGRAMHWLVGKLDELGYAWAYRVVDTRSFGLPQRRQRVIMLASPKHDPREVLFADEAGEPQRRPCRPVAHGFYWTEGNTGLGWAVDAIPTLKGGSAIGIPSAPAIWLTNGLIVTPDIADAERLQGFPAGWSQAANGPASRRNGSRWRLIGNAVTVNVARWVGRRLSTPGEPLEVGDEVLQDGELWPVAAWGKGGKTRRANGITSWPLRERYNHLEEFLRHPGQLLSVRATQGFLSRLMASGLQKGRDDAFVAALHSHLRLMMTEASSSGGE